MSSLRAFVSGKNDTVSKSTSALSCVLFGLCLSLSGCGGGTDEIPPTSGLKNSASQEEIQKQIEQSMKNSGAKYNGGKMPGQK